MKLNIIHQTGDFRGDHTADVAVAMDPIQGETVEELVSRARLGKNRYASGDYLEIRLIQAAPQEKAEPPAPERQEPAPPTTAPEPSRRKKAEPVVLNPEVKMDCPFCDGRMVRRSSAEYGPFYGCTGYPRCTATVGCHPNGDPLGTPALQATKDARKAAHAAFDPLWKDKPTVARSMAYQWLAEKLGIDVEDCHIGLFDEAACYRVVEICLQAKARGDLP